MTANRFVLFGALTMSAIVAAFMCAVSIAADETAAKSEGQAVKYTSVGMGEYQNFLVNWDHKKQAVLYALVQTPGQYDALFHPAPVMRDKRPYAPDKKIYAKEQILMVARVMAAPKERDKVFAVERVTEKGEELALYYRFNEPRTKATWSAKIWLGLRIPWREYKKVTLFENGKQVGELKLAEGQWSVPAMAPKPNKTDAGDGK